MAQSNNSSDISAWMDNISRYPVLPADRVHAIAKQIQSLPEDSLKRKQLVNKLVQHNLRLVVRFVESFMKNSHNKWGSPETVDYLQVGALGLMSAAQKYDPTLGYTFATYANYWIRATVSRYNMKTLTPVYVSESVSRRILFYKRNGYMKSKYDSRRISDEQASAIVRQATLAYDYLSLDFEWENGKTLYNCIADERVTEEPSNEGLMDQIWLEANVSDIGQRILTLSYVERRTTKQIAEELRVSSSTVKTEKRKAVLAVRACPTAINSGIL